jgi:hypothetical protein
MLRLNRSVTTTEFAYDDDSTAQDRDAYCLREVALASTVPVSKSRLYTQCRRGVGRFWSLHTWLSQFSYDDSRADALRHLPGESALILLVQSTADECVLPHHPHNMFAAIQLRLSSRGRASHFTWMNWAWDGTPASLSTNSM